VTIDIRPVNDAPVLGSIGDKSVNELTTLTFTAKGSDVDGDGLIFSLGAGAPDGTAIDAQTGAFSWTPTEAQGPGSYPVTVRVTDSGAPSLSDEETITIRVAEVDTPPQILPITAPGTLAYGDTLTVDVDAINLDFPPQGLVFSLDQKPDGASINFEDGTIHWTPTAAQAGGRYDFAVRVTDEGGLFDTETFTVAVAGGFLQVVDFVPTESGFVAKFNRSFDASQLNLYDVQGNPLGGSDVILTDPSGQLVPGSLVLDADSQGLTFVKTGGPLATGPYSVTLRSAANGFADTLGRSLDGNGDGKNGDDFVKSFDVAEPAARGVALPDFMRGPGQENINVPAVQLIGLPIRISNGDGVESVTFKLRYDPAKLTIKDVQLARGVSGDLSFAFEGANVLNVSVQKVSGLAGANAQLLQLIASVPTDAKYGSAEVLDLFSVSVNGTGGFGDDAVHLVGYIGDADESGGYGDADVTLIRRVSTGVDGGFAAYAEIDPVIVADINVNDMVDAGDYTFLRLEIGGTDRAEIPPLPAAPAAFASPAAAVSSTPAAARFASSTASASQPNPLGGDATLSGGSIRPVSVDVGPVIDWAGQSEWAAAKKKKELESGDATKPAKPAWRGDFVSNLAASEAERNPNARMRVTHSSETNLGKPLYKLPKSTF
jgi:hypothetical protein